MKGDFSGTGKVFKFTLSQLFKSKANIISLVLIVTLCLVSLPVVALFTQDTEELTDNYQINIENLYYIDATDLEIDPSALLSYDFMHISHVKKADFAIEEFESKTEEGSVLVVFSQHETGKMPACAVSFNNVDDKEELLSHLSPYLSSLISVTYLRKNGADDEAIMRLSKPSVSYVYSESEYLDPDDGDEDIITGFTVQYAYSILLMMLVLMTSVYIIRSVIEEKASKVVETLMVSVKPLATVAGKVLSVMTYSFTLVGGMIFGFIISFFITRDIMSSDIAVGIESIFSTLNFTPFTVAAALISLIIAFFAFAAISAIRGGGCSVAEDVESANLSVCMLVIASYVASVIVTPFAGGAFAVVCALIPFLSAFCALPMYITGAIGLPMLIVSWVLQAVYGILLIYFGASVYKYLIVYNGAKLKTSDIIRIFRGKEIKKA